MADPLDTAVVSGEAHLAGASGPSPETAEEPYATVEAPRAAPVTCRRRAGLHCEMTPRSAPLEKT